MPKSKSSPSVRLLRAVLALLALGALAVLPLRAAEVKYVTTYTGSVLTTCDPYCNNPLSLPGVVISTFGSTAIASPDGVPSRTKCTYGVTNTGTINWSIKPATTVDTGIYRIEIAHTATSSCTPDAQVTAYSNDGIVSATCTNSILFQRAQGGDVWRTMGYITNNPEVGS